METILEKAQKIIESAKNDENFLADNSHHLIATGERSVDYSLYCFDLSEHYYLLVDFVDFSYEDFSIVNKAHVPQIYRLHEEEQEEQ